MTVLLTQAIKQFYYNRKSEASPNVIALINAIVVGGGGTAGRESKEAGRPTNESQGKPTSEKTAANKEAQQQNFLDRPL